MKKLILLFTTLLALGAQAQDPIMVVHRGERLTLKTDLPPTTDLFGVETSCYFAVGGLEVIPGGIRYTIPQNSSGGVDYLTYDNFHGTRFTVPFYILGSSNAREELSSATYEGVVPIIGNGYMVLEWRSGGKGDPPGGKFRKAPHPKGPKFPGRPPEIIPVNPGDPEYWLNQELRGRKPRPGDTWFVDDPLGPSSPSNSVTPVGSTTLSELKKSSRQIDLKILEVGGGFGYTDEESKDILVVSFFDKRMLQRDYWKFIPPWMCKALLQGTATFLIILEYKDGVILRRTETKLSGWNWVPIWGVYP